ncbi:MAG: hypothetical protein A3F84_08140 [Candidatus Handelsmanbacteria bacterium RIFCSPLOWO2_12_FULL_64_10]|uniref:Uncharacterized protein n=1 Tax=Handelsmanbacteria sp. (strain RIFCSPLOWO2_12_FULL_64_10) TaxID=1817868 RepID=A0A1F6CQ71_HANXR|nr:MAG: hypothetical protein A3F84_08140 [Candidatus Handelsmanbacteria bacterium RIFCSPLOWO2_12_FULL_64_10]
MLDQREAVMIIGEGLREYEGFDSEGRLKVVGKRPFQIIKQREGLTEFAAEVCLQPFQVLIALALYTYFLETHNTQYFDADYNDTVQPRLDAAIKVLEDVQQITMDRDKLEREKNYLSKTLDNLRYKVAPKIKTVLLSEFQEALKKKGDETGFLINKSEIRTRLMVVIDWILKKYTNLTQEHRHEHVAGLLNHFKIDATQEGVRQILLGRSKKAKQQLEWATWVGQSQDLGEIRRRLRSSPVDARQKLVTKRVKK